MDEHKQALQQQISLDEQKAIDYLDMLLQHFTAWDVTAVTTEHCYGQVKERLERLAALATGLINELRLDSPINAGIGIRIRELRKAKGWTQGDLAQWSRSDHVYISKIENGRAFPGPRVITRIAIALGVDVDTLYGETQEA